MDIAQRFQQLRNFLQQAREFIKISAQLPSFCVDDQAFLRQVELSLQQQRQVAIQPVHKLNRNGVTH